jgi:hypothetical protein
MLKEYFSVKLEKIKIIIIFKMLERALKKGDLEKSTGRDGSVSSLIDFIRFNFCCQLFFQLLPIIVASHICIFSFTNLLLFFK